ncbi:hypothetical protein FBR01_12260 [Anaerolineae bacterium CFX8]|nr:hypothetical protein [Anaerolineae bacterium CFX8]
MLLFGLLLALPAAAQESSTGQGKPNPLLEMLALVPDTAEVWDSAPITSYADYRVLEAARGISTPTKADFDNRTDTARLWLAASGGLFAGFPMQYFMQYLEGMEEAVGFGWFDVNRALSFGQPPAVGNVLAGDFDAASIAAAFTARDFTSSMTDDMTIWCGPAGCDEGQALNLRSRNPANPFGGALGREEPLAVLPGLVLNSADYSVLTAMIGTQQGEIPSLADNPLFQAAARALAARGTLRQAVFFSVASTGFGYTMPDPDGEQPTFEGFGTLPPYLLMVVADVVTEDQEKTYVGLVYGDRETAQAASEELVARFQVAQSARAQQPFLTLIEERGGTLGAPTMHDDLDAGAAVALLEINKPLPSNELQPDGGYAPSALLFGLLMQSIYARDLSIVGVDINAAP